jgi:hypothetical protein
LILLLALALALALSTLAGVIPVGKNSGMLVPLKKGMPSFDMPANTAGSSSDINPKAEEKPPSPLGRFGFGPAREVWYRLGSNWEDMEDMKGSMEPIGFIGLGGCP